MLIQEGTWWIVHHGGAMFLKCYEDHLKNHFTPMIVEVCKTRDDGMKIQLCRNCIGHIYGFKDHRDDRVSCGVV